MPSRCTPRPSGTRPFCPCSTLPLPGILTRSSPPKCSTGWSARFAAGCRAATMPTAKRYWRGKEGGAQGGLSKVLNNLLVPCSSSDFTQTASPCRSLSTCATSFKCRRAGRCVRAQPRLLPVLNSCPPALPPTHTRAQDWDFASHTFWLKHGVALLFDCLHLDDKVLLAYNSAQVLPIDQAVGTRHKHSALVAAQGARCRRVNTAAVCVTTHPPCLPACSWCC